MKEVQVKLDEKSIQILKSVDTIHRDSLINIGLALVSKTGYYKTLTGKNEDAELEEVASLDVLDDEDSNTGNGKVSGASKNTKNTKNTKNAKSDTNKTSKIAPSWDGF